ncbi:MAG: HDIG domain-containing protein [Candidatus Hydrogenedentes bacterium]|nr:HDIG domain-containing protein [Candidatus Hydrogenedentota bacterium]
MSVSTGENPLGGRLLRPVLARIAGRFRARGVRANRMLLAGAFLVCVASLTREPSPDLLVGMDLESPIATREVRAAFYYEAPDIQLTQEARELEMAKVPDYYRVDPEKVNAQLLALREKIARLREARGAVLEALPPAAAPPVSDQSPAAAERAARAVAVRLRESGDWADMPDADLLAPWLLPDKNSLSGRPAGAPEAGPEGLAALPEPAPPTFFDADRLGSMALAALEEVLNAGVRGAQLAEAQRQRRVVVWRQERSGPDTQEGAEVEYGNVPTVADAVEALGARLVTMAKRATQEQSNLTEADYARIQEAVMAVCGPLVAPTLSEDMVAATAARARAAESVPPVMKGVEAGEIIQDRGKRWTKQSRSDAQTYLGIIQREERPLLRVVNTLFSNIILTLISFAALYKLCAPPGAPVSGRARPGDGPPQFAVALTMLCMVLVMGRVTSYFEPSGFVLPVAAGAILCAILVGAQTAAFFSAVAAVLVSAQYQYNWRLMLVAWAMALAGALTVRRVRRRGDMTAASLAAMAAGFTAAVAVTLSTESLLAESFLRRLMLILLNGGFCMMAVPGLLSPLERFFGLTTDITLLEYSDLNSPILADLAMKAPATYAHSLFLGQIAERAADAIGANGLLARVCAYYHDIGKSLNAESFTENQSGRNVHDTLSPAESAVVIRDHVARGVEIARRAGLPRVIVDGIIEHHGTNRISFFYEKAVERTGGENVDEAAFRYPGPRPQRPETAILMIGDAAESGVRSLDAPTEAQVLAFVRGILDSRSRDGQFDECDLTLKQLNTIAEITARTIMSALHTRIKYPTSPMIPAAGAARAAAKEKTA